MTRVESKKGISLIILALTIIVIVILSSVIIVNSNDNRASALKTLFIENLTTVEDATRTYYILNGKMPLPTNEDADLVLTASQITERSTSPQDLEEEIVLNGDETQSFYVVNLSLLDLENISSGRGYNINSASRPNDIYVVSSESFNAYYLAGQDIKGVRYFSLSSKLTNIDRKEKSNVVDSSVTSISANQGVVYSGRINVLKGNNSSNSLDTKISINLEFGDVVKVKTTNTEFTTANIKLGENVYTLKDILTNEQITDLRTDGSITIKMVRGDSDVENKIINVMGTIYTAPTISDINELYFYDNENTIVFDVLKGDSDIEYIKYSYFNIFDFDSSTGYISYQSQLENNQWVKYTDESGKKAKFTQSGRCAITVPKNVRDILVIAKDKNGNITYMSKTLYPIYANAEIVDQTSSKTTVRSDIVADVGTRVRMSYSADGSNYSMPEEIVTNSETFGAILTFDNLPTYKIYVKTSLIVSGKEYSFVNVIDTLKKVTATNEEEINDGTPLTLIISADKFSPTYSPDITYTFKFSRNVIGFDINDINVINGEKIDFSGSGKEYKLKVFNSQNSSFMQEVKVPAGACIDANSNPNDAVSIVVNVNRSVPSLYSLYVDYPTSGTYVTGQRIDIKAQFDGTVYDSNGRTYSQSLENAPILKIRFGNGITKELMPTYGSENQISIKNLNGSNSASSFSGSRLDYTYTVTEEDMGELTLVYFETSVYNASNEQRYISASNFDGSKIAIGEQRARIGDQGYGGIQEAIDDILDNTQNAVVINLTANVETTEGFSIPETKNVVINLNGHTILSNTEVFLNSGKLDIEGNGNIETTSTSAYAIENTGEITINSVNINSDGGGIKNTGSKLTTKYSNITCNSYGIYSENTKSLNQNVEIDRLEVNVTGSANPKTSIYIKDAASDIANTNCNARIYLGDTSGSLKNAKVSSVSRTTVTSNDSNALYVDRAIVDVTRGTFKSTATSAIYNNVGAIRMYEPQVEGVTASVSAINGDTYIEVGTFKSTGGHNINVDGGNLIINAITFNTQGSYSDVYAKSPAKVYYYKELSFTHSGTATFYEQNVYTNEPIYV